MKDTDIKKSMYLEFENKDSIINIKSELFESMKKLKQDDLINSEGFRLEDTMAAFVTNHYKMDPHSHNEKIENSNDKNENLKKIENYNYKDSLYTVFDLFKKEISLLYNIPIYQCYLTNTLSFISEEDFNINDMDKLYSNIVCSFILSYKYVIYLIFHSIPKTSCLRDEDVPSFLYSNCKYLNKPKSFDILIEMINILENQEKSGEEKQIIEQIILILKLQKGLIDILKKFLNEENEEIKEIKLTKDNYDKIIDSILELTEKINIEVYPKDIDEKKKNSQK